MNLEVNTPSKHAEPVFQSPLSTSVLTAEDIARSGASDWGEALRLLPGVIVRAQSNGNYDIHIRGLENLPPDTQLPFLANTLTLVMIDNRIVYNYFAGGTFWESLPIGLEQVAQIELVRGPGAALYGPNAVSGVINIITHRPESGTHFNARAEGGKGEQAQLRLSHKQDRWAWQLHANGNQQNRDTLSYYSLAQGTQVDDVSQLTLFSTGATPSDLQQRFPEPELANQTHGLNTDLFYTPSDTHHYRISTGIQKSKVQSAYFENGITPFNTSRSDTHYIDSELQWQQTRAQVSYLNGTQQNLGLDAWHWNFHTLDINLETQLDYSTNLKLMPGASYRNASYEADFLGGHRVLTTRSAWLRADYTPSARWRMVTGLRLDKYHTPNNTEVSAQLTLSYQANAKQHWRLGYGRAHRAPLLVDMYQASSFIAPPNSLFELFGNQALDPLTTNTFELGLRHQISRGQYLEADAFYIDNSNYSDVVIEFAGIDGDGFRTTGRYQNLPLSPRLYGITLSHSYQPVTGMELKTYITLSDGEVKAHQTQDPRSGDLSVTLQDRDNLTTPGYYGGVIWNLQREKWHINLNLYGFKGHTQTHIIGDDHIPTKWQLNTSLGYRFTPHLQGYISVKNLAKDTSREFWFSDKDARQLKLGIRVDF